MISILVPVLGRPERAQQLVDSIRSTEDEEHQILFLCSPGDSDEIMACHHTDERFVIVEWQAGPGDYARKMNRGLELTSNPFLLLGADDLRFHPGWDTSLLGVAEQTGAGVIGSNDMGNPQVYRRGEFSTHPLVRRSYIEEQGGSADGPGILCHEGYDHNYVDRELWDVAQARDQTAFALDAKIEHLHPNWRKGKMDSTYEKGLKHFHQDQRLYWSRFELWGKQLSPRQQSEIRRFQRREARLG